jgi:hypothetical protein
MSQADQRENFHQHSGWLIPAIFIFAILLLSGLFLGWYLRPGPKPVALPTDKSNQVKVRIHDLVFAIPANYIQNSATRSGGEQESVALAALFPSWQGYSDANARLFAGNAPDSPVVRLLLHTDSNPLDVNTRLERIYRPYIREAAGTPGFFGLTKYSFTANSGYEDNELFAGADDKGLMLFLCERPSAELPSPNCLAPDRPMGKTVSYTYRFKRAYLARWPEISAGVQSLIARFQSKG